MANNFIRPVPPADNYTSAWGSNLGQQVNANKVVAGQGVKVTQGNNGTTISIPDEPYPVSLNYAGVYSFSQSYNPNDVVYVDPQQTYWDQDGNVIPVCQGSSSLGLPPICAGLFVATQFVPAYGWDSSYLATIIADTSGSAYLTQNISSDFANTFRWYSLNCYWPIFPTIPTSSLTTVTESVDSTPVYITANQNYWAPLSPMYLAISCDVNGNNQQVFTNGVISGSMFNPALLPHT